MKKICPISYIESLKKKKIQVKCTKSRELHEPGCRGAGLSVEREEGQTQGSQCIGQLALWSPQRGTAVVGSIVSVFKQVTFSCSCYQNVTRGGDSGELVNPLLVTFLLCKRAP